MKALYLTTIFTLSFFQILIAAMPSAVAAAGEPDHIPNPAFIKTETTNGNGHRDYWTSQRFQSVITGLEIDDVDKDGLKEMVLAFKKTVGIYHVQDNKLIKSVDIAKTRLQSYISVDIGDINGNEIPEIFITSLGSGRSTVESFVMEYSGNEYRVISKGNNWYYRIAHTVDQGTFLLGQRQRAAEESVFSGAVYKMHWKDGHYVPGQLLLKGGSANLMGVAYGDIMQTGRNVTLAYTDNDRLRLFGSKNEPLWEDSQRSGGNMEFFNLSRIEPGEPNKQFFPLRIRFTDIRRDGKIELLLARHEALDGNMLRDFRHLKNATLESMVWDGLTLSPIIDRILTLAIAVVGHREDTTI